MARAPDRQYLAVAQTTVDKEYLRLSCACQPWRENSLVRAGATRRSAAASGPLRERRGLQAQRSGRAAGLRRLCCAAPRCGPLERRPAGGERGAVPSARRRGGRYAMWK